MNTLAFVLPDADLTHQQELSYAVLSALKHCADPDALDWVLASPDDVRRDDLPLHHVTVPASATPRLTALQALCQTTSGKICLIDAASDIRVDPAKLFDRIDPDHALLHTANGVLGDRPALADAVSTTQLPPQTRCFSPKVLGLDSSRCDVTESISERIKGLVPTDAETAIGLMLAEHMQIETCDDLVVHHSGHRRHIYHGRLRNMFPQGRVVDARAMAPSLPVIKAPPQPLILKLRSRVFALTHRLDQTERAAYLAYLCSQSAPTAQGRDVWANIALDMVQSHTGQPDTYHKTFKAFAPAALQQADLTPQTLSRWSAYWDGSS